MECLNCGAGEGGRTRRLRLDGRRRELPLCDPCFDSFLRAEWIEAAG